MVRSSFPLHAHEHKVAIAMQNHLINADILVTPFGSNHMVADGIQLP
jgi:hypothetical protein